LQVVQAIQPTALPGLREAYTQTMNVVIRKELRLYASNLRKAVAAHFASSPAEPDMGLAHKRVGASSTSYNMLRLVLSMIPLSSAITLCAGEATCTKP